MKTKKGFRSVNLELKLELLEELLGSRSICGVKGRIEKEAKGRREAGTARSQI